MPRAQPEPEIALGLAPAHRPRHGHLAFLIPAPDGNRIARKLDLMAVELPGSVGEHLRRSARLCHERPAGQASNRSLSGFANRWSELNRRGRVGQERHRPRIADVPQGRGRVGRQARVSAVEHRQQRRNRRAVEPADVAHQQRVLLRGESRTLQRFHQGRHRIGAGFPEPGYREILFCRGPGQTGHETGKPIGLGRIPLGGIRELAGERLGEAAGCRFVRQPQDRSDPEPVADLDEILVAGLALEELVQVRDRLRTLPGPAQIIDRAPELQRGPRLLGERLGPRHLGKGRCGVAHRRKRHDSHGHSLLNQGGPSTLHAASIPDRHILTTEEGHAVFTHGRRPIL